MNTDPSNPQTCRRCGAALSVHDLDGLCSRCVARISLLEPEDGRRKTEDGSQKSGAGPSPQFPDSSLPLTVFGDYELLDEIARGGMGVVYRARQVSLDRVVAVKMLLLGQFAAPGVFQRFRAEAVAAASLQHPNIVAIHEVGTHDGQPFFSMDYVAGRNLTDLVRDRPLPARAATQHLVKIARAVQYAHDHGILHRDLKPANILVDESDEPRITDFGLAKRLTSDSSLPTDTSSLTLSGQILGSPNFLPPEQAGGHARTIGPACDIYGLGAVLYYLLAARPPFVAETFESTLFHVLNTDPVPPRQLNPSVPRDLETICLKCLEKEPGRRYATAGELADELDRFLKGEPIRARSIGTVGRTWRWCRRKPALAGAFAAIGTLLLTVTAVSVTSAWRIATARKGEQREAYYSNIALANQYIEQGSIDRALETLMKCPEQYRHWEWGHLLYLCHQDAASFQAHATNVTATFFSPDSKWVVSQDAAGLAKVWDWEAEQQVFGFGSSSNRAGWIAFHPSGGQLAAAMGTNGVWVWATTNWGISRDRRVGLAGPSEPSRVLPTNLGVAASRQSAAILASGSLRRSAEAPLRLRDSEHEPVRGNLSLSDGEGAGARRRSAGSENPQSVIALRLHSGEVTTLAYSPSGQQLVTGGADGAVAVWDSGTGQQLSRQETTNQPIRRVAISPDGQRLVAVAERAAWVWELDSGKLIRSFPDDFVRENPSPLQGAGGFDASGPRAAPASAGLPGANLPSPFQGLQPTPVPEEHRATLLPEGPRTLAGGANPRAGAPHDPAALEGRRSDAPSEAPSAQAVQPQQTTELKNNLAAVFADDTGEHFATIDNAGQLTLWREGRAPQRLITIRGGIPEPVRRVFFSPDGRWMANGGEENTAHVWDLATGTERLSVGERVRQVVFSRDGNRMVTGGGQNWVTMWDLTQGRKLKVLRGHLAIASAVSLSFDGRLVTSAEDSGIVKVWSAGPGRELAQDRTWQWDVQFSPDGRLTANCPFHEGIVIRSARSGRELMRIHTPNESFFVAAFSPDSRRLATVGTQKTGKVWDLETGQLLLRLRGHRRETGPVVYSHDGRRIATGSLDGTAKIWDAQTGQELLTLLMDPQRGYALTGLSNGVACLVFDSKDERLLTGGADGKVRIWEVASGRLLRTLDPGEKSTSIEGCFLPDPRYIITDADRRIQVWEISTGRLVAQATGRGACRGAAVSRDGRRWFVASAEAGSSHATVTGHSTLEIWDIEQSPRRILELSGRALFAWLTLGPHDRVVACPAIDFCVHRWETFPWREEEYPEMGGERFEVGGVQSNSELETRNPKLAGASSPRLLQDPHSPSKGMAERVRAYARRYWRERLDWELNGAEGEPAEPRIVKVPVDRTLFAKSDLRATADQLDLTDFYTGELGEMFFGQVGFVEDHDNDLSELPIGLMQLGGVEFDIRGVIQVRRAEPLGGPWELAASDDAVRVDGIPVQQEAARLHLVLGTVLPEADGTVIGRLVLHYADGETRPLDLVYGRDVRDWWYDPARADAETTDRAKVVWTGLNPVAHEHGRRLRLYLNTRENPRPGVKITSFDFVSAMSNSAPFLIAMTVE